MWLARLFFVLIVLSIWTKVYAKERIALVIGNADYTSSALVNSVNDAEDIASTLENLEFSVTLVKNATKDKMQAAISKFVDNLNDDTVGLFYYSGHAVQYKGSNYLIPIGSLDKVDYVEDLPKNTVNTNTVLDGLNQSQSNLNFIFLDACRDNPFKNLSKEIIPGLAKTSVGARNTSQNLIMEDVFTTRGVSETHEQVKDTKGILVAYSTMPGSVASDGSGRNSPYTKSLLKHITKTNSLAQIMLSDVQQDVQQSTNGRQTPVLESAITGRFCFNETNNGCGKAVVNIHSSYLKGLKDIQKLTLPDGSSYKGQVVDGKPHGKGVQIHGDSTRYEGEWRVGVASGKGSMYYNDGGFYEGVWKDDFHNGLGVSIFKDGTRYEGEHKDGFQNGFGIQVFTNGSRYEGIWKDGRPHGLGKYRWPNGDYREGLWIDGEQNQNSKVIFITSSGYRHEGEIKNNLPDGRGVRTWTDGSHYQGNWKKGKQDGFGILTWANGDIGSGEWKHDALIKGLIVYADGSHKMGEWNDKGEENGVVISKKANGDYIETHSKNGVPYGSSIILLNDGTRFEGELNWDAVTKYGKNPVNVNSLKKNKIILKALYSSKHAIVTRPGGFRYEGALKDGEPDGYGIGNYGNSRRIEGEFKNGLPHGHIIEVIDGVRWEGEYLNGSKVEESDKTSNSVSNFLKKLFN